MSIYATLWSLKFPRYGDDYVACEWIKIANCKPGMQAGSDQRAPTVIFCLITSGTTQEKTYFRVGMSFVLLLLIRLL
jgi:hypothetical protein